MDFFNRLIAYATRYRGGSVENIKTVIVALEPVVLALIGAIAYEDGQAMKAEASKP